MARDTPVPWYQVPTAAVLRSYCPCKGNKQHELCRFLTNLRLFLRSQELERSREHADEMQHPVTSLRDSIPRVEFTYIWGHGYGY